MILVASAEFTLKSSAVRRTLEQRLIDDLKTALTRAGMGNFSVEKHAARIVIRGVTEARLGAKCCARVFGVAYAAPGVVFPLSKEGILNTIAKVADEALSPGQSFAIRAHRSTSSHLSRREIEVQGGSEVLRALKDRGVTVDLNQPDMTIFVDLADDRAYVYRERLQGPGGLPLSSQWKMLAVLDSGPLTLLAAFAMMRRGCLVELLIPVSESIPSFARDSQLGIARRLRELVTRTNYRAFLVEFEDLVREQALINSSQLDFPKRLVREAAIKFAIARKFRGIIFADVGGEIVSKQRMAGIAQIPVLYPLIGLEKEDLIELCREAGIPEDLLSKEDYTHAERTLVVGVSSIERPVEMVVKEISL